MTTFTEQLVAATPAAAMRPATAHAANRRQGFGASVRGGTVAGAPPG